MKSVPFIRAHRNWLNVPLDAVPKGTVVDPIDNWLSVVTDALAPIAIDPEKFPVVPTLCPMNVLFFPLQFAYPVQNPRYVLLYDCVAEYPDLNPKYEF